MKPWKPCSIFDAIKRKSHSKFVSCCGFLLFILFLFKILSILEDIILILCLRVLVFPLCPDDVHPRPLDAAVLDGFHLDLQGIC